MIGTFRQRLLWPWLAFVMVPVCLCIATFSSYGWAGVVGDAASPNALDVPLCAGAATAIAAAISVLRRGVGHGLGQRASIQGLSQLAKWWRLDIHSVKDLDALRFAVDTMAPRVIAWLVAEAAFVAGTAYSRELGARVLTSAVNLFILFVARP